MQKRFSFFAVVSAIFTRLIFTLHCVIAAWRVVEEYRDSTYFLFLVGLVLLIVETLYTVVVRKGQEYKWFSPCVFIYLLTIIPCIWFLELQRLEDRIKIRDSLAQNGTNNPTVPNNTNSTLFTGVTLPILIPENQWVVMIEQLLLFILIIGRWLLPKGEITRDELSQLLMVYLGMAADIIEFFEAFKEEQVKYNWTLTVAIMAIWSASLTQFTLVVTASKSRKTRAGFQEKEEAEDKSYCSCFDTEVFGILTTMFLQDAPFFVLRMILIFRYSVKSYMHLFFTIKNAMVLSILIYRLIVISFKPNKKSDYDEIEGASTPEKES